MRKLHLLRQQSLSTPLSDTQPSTAGGSSPNNTVTKSSKTTPSHTAKNYDSHSSHLAPASPNSSSSLHTKAPATAPNSTT